MNLENDKLNEDAFSEENSGVNESDATEPAVEEKSELRWEDKCKDLEDQLLRAQAEFENSRKRLQKRSDDMVKFSNESFVLALLPLMDDMDRAIQSLDEGHDLKTIQQGLHLVQSNFHKTLEQNGVEKIKCLNQPFDPNLHEAVGEIVVEDGDEDEVLEEMQSGFMLNGRLARPSKVKISKKN